MRNKSYFTLRQICMMSFLAVMGMFIKPVISPVFNLLTDFVRIPGGSVTAGFSMLFLVFASGLTGKFGTATLMGVVQAVIALSTGVSSVVGLLVFVTYSLPGLAIDTVLCTGIFKKIPMKPRMALAGAAAVFTGAAFTNMLYYRLSFVPFLLFYIFGALSGALGGGFAFMLTEKIPRSVIKNMR
ncbi:MAG: ECF transporter S component [Oscillospiraceae bacterium]|nr:ECF transporter S component [Oscillospiraceae bacterium]